MAKLREFVSENTYVCMLLLVFVTMTMCAGSNFIVGVLCICLCGMGFFVKEVRIDMKMFLLMMFMFGFASLSSMQTVGTPFSGYVSKWMLFLVLYLWLGCLSEKESYVLRKYVVYWVAVIAGLSLLTFFVHAVMEGGGRLGGVLGNPNSTGIFLVIGWFLLNEYVSENRKLLWLEPLYLVVLAMTFSMGSFLSMVIALLHLGFCHYKDGLKYAVCYVAICIVRIGLCFWIGFLFYWSSRAMYPHWLCVFPMVLLILAMWTWKCVYEFLINHVKFVLCVAVCCTGLLFVAVYLRPSAFATFAERLDMMQAAMPYLKDSTVSGVGPYRWRGMDLSDGGTYFNTWYIHNTFLHVGVELGVLTMFCMIAIVVYYFYKKPLDEQKSGAAAFLVHSLIDVGFFYEVIPVLMFLSCVKPTENGRMLTSVQKNLFFGVLFCLNVWYVFRIVPYVFYR